MSCANSSCQSGGCNTYDDTQPPSPTPTTTRRQQLPLNPNICVKCKINDTVAGGARGGDDGRFCGDCFRGNLFGKFRFAVTSNAMICPDDKVLVAFSAGACSRVALQFVHEMQDKAQKNFDASRDKSLPVFGIGVVFIEESSARNFPTAEADETIQHVKAVVNDLAPPNKSWDDLMRIMTEIAYALSYMHNALSKPLVHRNLSSSSICLDTLDRAKLTRLGHTVSITPGDTSQRWHVKGTKGYIDPEYIDTHKVTDKCDVYSFGVVVIEVLTRRQPFIMARDGINLVDVFISAVRENRMKDMIDRRVLEQACWIEIQQFAQLALGCVAMKGINRPTMIDVVGQLWKIQGRDKK